MMHTQHKLAQQHLPWVSPELTLFKCQLNNTFPHCISTGRLIIANSAANNTRLSQQCVPNRGHTHRDVAIG